MSNIPCILYPPTLDYYYLVQRPQHLMKNFSEQGVSCLFMNLPGVYHRNFRGIEQINPQLHVFHEVDPKPYLTEVRPVIYYSATAQVDKVGEYKPSLVVFDSVDEPSDEFAAWKPYYYRAVASADLVLCTSQKLHNMARAINPHVYLIPNGCDYQYFSRAARKEMPLPYELKHLTGPIVGYIGVMATWCDLELVDKLARAYPQYNLVMVGPLYNVGRVPHRPNLHWLGFKAYEQLAAYAQAFDVGIIPFRQSSMTESVNPIKMWEYMAAGMPVVTTALPEARIYSDIIYCSDDHAAFIDNVRLAIENDTEEKRQLRMALARQNSWESRALEITRLMEHHLALKDPDYSINGRRPQIMPFRELLPPQNQDFRKNLSVSSPGLTRKKPHLSSVPGHHESKPGRSIKSWQTPRYIIPAQNEEYLVSVSAPSPAYKTLEPEAGLRFQKSGVYIDSRARIAEKVKPWMLE